MIELTHIYSYVKGDSVEAHGKRMEHLPLAVSTAQQDAYLLKGFPPTRVFFARLRPPTASRRASLSTPRCSTEPRRGARE